MFVVLEIAGRSGVVLDELAYRCGGGGDLDGAEVDVPVDIILQDQDGLEVGGEEPSEGVQVAKPC